MKLIRRAVKAAGGTKAVATRFDIHRQAVEKWVKENRLPAERVLVLEEMSGIPRHELRPDIYPRENAA